jgi:hypothetical protein
MSPSPPAPRTRLAILLPTWDDYATVAGVTLRRLDACWPEHPEVFVCGVGGAPPPLRNLLPLAADPRDWVGIVLDAVRCVEAQGFEWLYVILDDHPPFGPCNADYLNRRLPENAAALGAIQVNLLGWDQYQPRDGVLLGRNRLYWQRNSPSFRWKFSLHPGLWHVLALRGMLESLRSNSPDVRSAREFEGAVHGACLKLDPQLLERTYRVRGDGFTARDRWYESRRIRAATRWLIRPARLAARLGGARRVAAFDAALVTYYRYANGPYPMFWSGLVRHRRLHEEALRFLTWTGQAALADDIRKGVRLMG